MFQLTTNAALTIGARNESGGGRRKVIAHDAARVATARTGRDCLIVARSGSRFRRFLSLVGIPSAAHRLAAAEIRCDRFRSANAVNVVNGSNHV